jgi:hypothetical protein
MSILVALVAVGLFAPQQAAAINVGLPAMILEGNPGANVTSSNGNTTFSPDDFNPFFLTEAGFLGQFGINAGCCGGTLQPITWTGSGPTTVLVNGPIMNAWLVEGTTGKGVAFSFHFDLTELFKNSQVPTTDDPNFSLKGTGTVSGTLGSRTLSFPHAIITYINLHEGQPIKDGFFFDDVDVKTTVPDGGLALDLLAIGLVAVEGLRRKIGAVQKR